MIGQVCRLCSVVADDFVVDDYLAEHVVHDTFHYGPNSEAQRILKTRQICGNSELWEDIMAQSSVDSIQGIPWHHVIQQAHGYIEQMDLLEQSLEEQVEQLTDAIRKKTVTVPKYLTEDQIAGLIEESVSGEEAFGSLNMAQNTGCGDPFHGLRDVDQLIISAQNNPVRNRVRLPFNAAETSVEALRNLIRNLLTGCHRTSVYDFAGTCKELLTADTSYCEELCGAMSKTAGAISDMNSASNSCPPRHLATKLKEVLKSLGEVRTANSDCKYITPWIEQLRDEVKELEEAIRRAHDNAKNADRALYDAMLAIEQIQDETQTQQNAARSALQLLESMGEDVSTELRALKAAEEIEANANFSLKNAFLNMQQAQNELKKAQEANDVIEKVRGLVSMTMLKMALLFKDAVQVPIEGMGVRRDMHVQDQFPNITKIFKLQEAHKLMHDLTDFKTFCDGPAKAAFADVKQHVDLSPLCEFDAVNNLRDSVVSAVDHRATKLIQKIEFIQSYLDPMKGQPTIKPEMIKHAQTNGEPEGFRGIAGTFGDANLYGYLKGWKYVKKPKGDGWFLRLIKEFYELLTSAEGAHEQASRTWKAAADRLAQTGESKRQVELKLEGAMKVQAVQQQKVGEVTEALRTLQTSGVEAKAALDTLQERLKLAHEAYLIAKRSLVEHHKSATSYSFIETVPMLIPNQMTESLQG